ncbi:MAG: 3-hydroxyacyl-CoA dehydrogenase NAD-binding domain-containing protein [Polaromonas sp.]|nr:3-hydroxyacyl-CoA dehydrogenase NAD-binding domain-containing protein [Polaromonas sp.]
MSRANCIEPKKIQSIAVIGTGSVGASWATLFLAKGIRVYAYDKHPDSEQKTKAFVKSAWPALHELGVTALAEPDLTLLSFASTIKDAVYRADLVQENVYEDLEVKREVLKEIESGIADDTLIISSTGGIPPTELQKECRNPNRFVVVHPFNPSHLIPLVEVVGGMQTAPEVIDWAMEFARYMQKEPVHVKLESSGHLTNRLQFALVKEAVACLMEGVASASDIDRAVRYGLAPRWMLMGSLLTLHLAGGQGGMKGILNHAGQAIESWWTPRVVPKLDEKLIELLGQISSDVANQQDVQDWVKWRDEQLVNVLKLQALSQKTEPKE